MHYQPQNLLQNRIILVTGASDGIGREAALTYAEYGASVILTGRNEENSGESLRRLNLLAASLRPGTPSIYLPARPLAVRNLPSASALIIPVWMACCTTLAYWAKYARWMNKILRFGSR